MTSNRSKDSGAKASKKGQAIPRCAECLPSSSDSPTEWEQATRRALERPIGERHRTTPETFTDEGCGGGPPPERPPTPTPTPARRIRRARRGVAATRHGLIRNANAFQKSRDGPQDNTHAIGATCARRRWLTNKAESLYHNSRSNAPVRHLECKAGTALATRSVAEQPRRKKSSLAAAWGGSRSRC